MESVTARSPPLTLRKYKPGALIAGEGYIKLDGAVLQLFNCF